ncbi:MAG: undecaprenyl-diphosphate phosphatase [Candidatus Heimdallarchaeaceae archaeon]
MLIWILLAFAVLQGILEWLPVSSEGQTVTLLVAVLGIPADKAIEISLWLHIGTLLAVTLKYWRELFSYINPKVKDEATNQWRWFILLSTLGTVIVGVPCYLLVHFLSVELSIYGEFFMLIVGIALLVTAGLLFYSRKQQKEGKDIGELTKKEMTFSGFLQGFSIIPGISRSGTTMSGLLLMSVKKEEAVKGSFIMSIPAVLGGFILNLIVILIEHGNLFPLVWWQLIIAIIVTAIIGFLTMELFIRIAKKFNFAIICLVLGNKQSLKCLIVSLIWYNTAIYN